MSIDTIHPVQIQPSCHTTDEGAACSTSCACKTDARPTPISFQQSGPIRPRVNRWHDVRGMVMFGIACLTSPCCTPLIVPVILSLLAGSPLALWLGANIGWVYGGLTLMSVVSLVMALHWSRKTATSHRSS